MRFSLTFPALAANMAAVLAAPQPQDLNINMIVAAPDPTYSEAVGVTAQVVTLDSTAIAAQATSAVSSVSIAVSDVLSGTDVAKRDIAKRTACAPQPTGASMYSAAPTDPSAWASYSVFSSAAAAAPTPAGYTNTFSNLAASNNAYGYLGFTTLQSYDVNTCSQKCNAINGCMSFNLYFERDPSVDPGSGCSNPSPVTTVKCVFWGGPVNQANAVNSGQWRSSFQVLIAGSNGYTNNAIVTPPGFDSPTYYGNAAINAPYDGQGYNTLAGSTIFTQGGFNVSLCADFCNAQTQYNLAHPAADGSPPQVCHFFNTFILYLKSGSSRIPQGQYCTLYTETWDSSYATNTGQFVGSDQYLIEYSYGYPLSGSHGLSPRPGDKQGAIYQAVKDMSYYPASLTSTFQPFCSSILGYSAGSTTVTTAMVTPISYTTVTNVIYQRAASTNPTPAVLTKYPATVVSSACSSVVTSPTATPFVTSTATLSASAVISTVIASSTYVIPACSGPSEACAPFVGCGSGTYCECLQRIGGSAACIDPNQSPGSSCNSDSDCATGSICFSSCVGNTCQTFQDPNSGICINGNSAKYLFRRGPEARKAAKVPVADNVKRGLDCNTGKFYCEEV
ncbi:hypothetical protein KCV07_g9747, partial [Aureobasidium melanogenum]